ncbi:MAG TPA: hypothetical protein PLX73_01735, partial [Candidatus Paceibacterota bacterium]|nr:hypothetical protein [Candidatus Paceibacterota bacterium]
TRRSGRRYLGSNPSPAAKVSPVSRETELNPIPQPSFAKVTEWLVYLRQRFKMKNWHQKI